MNTRGPAILFVCTGNICRSPMAAALFKARLMKERADWQSWQIESAGTWASDGEAVSRNSVLAMAERGIDISKHTARTVTRQMLERFDLILTMEAGHKVAIQVEFPAVAGRVYLLSEMDGQFADVKDPYGCPLPDYRKTAGEIEQIIENGMPRILQLLTTRK